MRIYTIKGETQLSKSPQILVVYPTASDSVRPRKHISSKFPCTDRVAGTTCTLPQPI